MRRLLTCAILLTALTTHAQEAPNEVITRPTPRPTPKSRVIGHILCNDTRQPARGATVMLQPLPAKEQDPTQNVSQPLFSRVGLDGAFVINRVPPGDYALLAFLPGYLSPIDNIVASDGDGDFDKLMRDKLSSGDIIHVSADGTQTADLMLERGATVSGRVLYSDGAPASQVTIAVEDINAKPPAKPDAQFPDEGAMLRGLLTHQTLSTDDQGRFRVAGIHPGNYRVAVLQPPSFDSTGGDAEGDALGMSIMGGGGDPRSAHFYAGDTFHKKSAKTYDLRAGDTLADLEIRLPIDGFQEVRIHLAAVDGRPINSATLTLTDTTDDTIHFSIQTQVVRNPAEIGNVEGIYQFHYIPSATYTLTVTGASILGPRPLTPDPSMGAKAARNLENMTVIQPVEAFSDSTTTVIIKDSASSDLTLTLAPAPKSTPPS